VLIIVGTDKKDYVNVVKTGRGHRAQIKVIANFLPKPGHGYGHGRGYVKFDASEVKSIVMYLCDGDDKAVISSKVRLPSLVYGGEGNDHIVGGSGSDVLVGGPGKDKLIGKNGNDILIGGTGRDHLVGGRGEDILIGGSTIYDSDGPLTSLGSEALLAIQAEWNSGRPHHVRKANLTDGSGSPDRENDDFFLTLGGTVVDDLESDKLIGGPGCDWLFWGRRDYRRE
jgi:Ca2+-binding RTX toxin-like protein